MPASVAEAAEAVRAAAADGLTVRPSGGGTKLEWGHPVPEPDVHISTEGLGDIVEHNVADLTAVVQAGVPLAAAQARFAEAGQMVALDPAPHPAASLGGVVATADSGPLRHRYGAPRDLLLGITVVLGDGAVARSGGKVIKNVAGYDLAKLLAGSFGTLGLIVEMALRLHPLPRGRVTAAGWSDRPAALRDAVLAVSHAPLELESLDVRWAGGAGRLLARCAGVAPRPRAERAAALMREAGLEAELVVDDDALWEQQRRGQRADEGAVIRISGLPAALDRVIAEADRIRGDLVGRAAMGLSWLALPAADPGALVASIDELRAALAPFPCVVLDAPAEVREKLDVWGEEDGPAMALMRRVKASFDPGGMFNPGLFTGGI